MASHSSKPSTLRPKLNRGISQVKAIGLCIEGARYNSIPPSLIEGSCPNAHLTPGVKLLVPEPQPNFPGQSLWTVGLPQKGPFEISFTVTCKTPSFAHTLSMFAITSASTPIILRTCLSDGNEKKCEYLEITNSIRRFEVPFEFADAPSTITVSFQGGLAESAEEVDRKLGFGVLTLENGLFATSPIPAEMGHRSSCSLNYQREGNFSWDKAGTIMMHMLPAWSGPQLDWNSRAYFMDCMSENRKNGISIYSEGTDLGRIRALFTTNGHEQLLVTDIVPLKGHNYAIALRWTPGVAEILINGRVAAAYIGLDLPKSSELPERVYFGSTSQSEFSSAYAVISSMRSYILWLQDRDIQAILYQEKPNQYPNYIRQYQDYTDEPRSRLLDSASWPFQFINYLLRIPREWQADPPVWLAGNTIDESHCRDEIKRYLSVNNSQWTGIPEYHQHEGRSDLLVKDRENPDRNLYMEFKVWGRHDYKDVPEKPMKYFLERDNVGVVIMINSSKNKLIGKEYRTNVTSSPTDCTNLIDRPFESETSPDHFLSIHESSSRPYAEVLHIIVNKNPPHGVKHRA